MKKPVGIISVLMALSVISAMPFSADAAGNPLNGDYVGTVQLSRYGMTAEEAAGGASVEASAYIRGAVKEGMIVKSAQAGLTGDQQLYMRDLVDVNKTTSVQQTYTSLGKSFTTAYNPFCFGKVSGGVYSSNTYMVTGRVFCVDPVNGGALTYLGDDTISFKLPGRFYVDENGNLAQDSVSHVITCPLTVQPDGSATYTFKYADIYSDHVDVAEAVGVIPYYQPELLETGGKIPDANNKFVWMADVSANTSFLGNSNDFPLLQTSVYLKAGSPCGIYEIGFDEEFCRVSYEYSGKSYELPLSYRKAAVAVGVESAVVTSPVPEYACYFAEDSKIITGVSAGGEYICDVTYSDGTGENGKNVTGAVNAGTSAAAIISGADSSYFIGDIPMYCGETPLTLNGSAGSVKALIGKKGDADLDGAVTLADAGEILKYYARNAAGLDASLTGGEDAYLETLAFFLGDIDTESQTMSKDGILDINDASAVLSYYANTAAGNAVSWDAYIK
ncbi:MAG: hypothetical protein ACI4JN_11245 [Ruminococcus sp.]